MSTLLKTQTPKTPYTPIRRKLEDGIHARICTYLRIEYPDVIFRTDFAAGRIALTPNQGRMYARLQSSRAFPDLFIFKPSTIEDQIYYGLALELKRDGTTIIVKRGERKGHLTSDPHIREQFLMLKELRRQGYFADFAVGFEAAKKKIDWYFSHSAPKAEAMF